MNEKKIKNSVHYRVLIKNNDVYYKIGSIIVRTYYGDLLYTPSSNFHDIKNVQKKEIDHISWHQSGRVSIKYKNQIIGDEYLIIEKKENRQKISEMGYQKLIEDTIVDYKKLPIHLKKVVELDVVFNVNDYEGAVIFDYSLVSGKLIAASYKGEKTPLKKKNIIDDLNGFQVKQRALGWHSGSADVMLQYSLKRTLNTELRTNRQIYIPSDMKISKLIY